MKKSDKVENSQSSSPVWEPLKNQIRSMEVTDMLDRPPSWLMKWGMYAILLAIGVAALSASIIHYPEAVETKLYISTYPASFNINANTGGMVKNVYVKDSSIVDKDQPIIELNSASDWETVQQAEKFAKDVLNSVELEDIDNLKYLSEKRRIETLGDRQEMYDDLLHTISIYLLNRAQRFHQTKAEISLMRLEIVNQTRKLSRGLESWKAKYLLTSPQAGRFYFSKPFRRGTAIKSIEEVGFVVPDKFAYQGQLMVSSTDAKKISVGQSRKLELIAFPLADYGLVEVTIDSMSKVQTTTEFNSTIRYRIYFKPLAEYVTNKNIVIPIRPNFSYNARIIIGEKSLLKRFMEMSAPKLK